MQSIKNKEKIPEETQGAEEITISLEDYSKLNTRLKELGCLNSNMRNHKLLYTGVGLGHRKVGDPLSKATDC